MQPHISIGRVPTTSEGGDRQTGKGRIGRDGSSDNQFIRPSSGLEVMYRRGLERELRVCSYDEKPKGCTSSGNTENKVPVDSANSNTVHSLIPQPGKSESESLGRVRKCFEKGPEKLGTTWLPDCPQDRFRKCLMSVHKVRFRELGVGKTINPISGGAMPLKVMP
jgi:hypothetical protein